VLRSAVEPGTLTAPSREVLRADRRGPADVRIRAPADSWTGPVGAAVRTRTSAGPRSICATPRATARVRRPGLNSATQHEPPSNHASRCASEHTVRAAFPDRARSAFSSFETPIPCPTRSSIRGPGCVCPPRSARPEPFGEALCRDRNRAVLLGAVSCASIPRPASSVIPMASK